MFVSRKRFDALHSKYKETLAMSARQKAEYEDFITALQGELRSAVVDAENMKQKNSLLTEKLAIADRIIKHYDTIREADHKKEAVEDAEWG